MTHPIDITLQQNNARTHIARVVVWVRRRQNILLMEWPAMLSDLAPVEHVWDKMGRLLRQGRNPQIARFMGPTWGLPGCCRSQVSPCWSHEPYYQGRLTRYEKRKKLCHRTPHRPSWQTWWRLYNTVLSSPVYDVINAYISALISSNLLYARPLKPLLLYQNIFALCRKF